MNPLPLQTESVRFGIDFVTITSAVAVLVGAYLLVRLVGYGLSQLAEQFPSRRLIVKTTVPLAKLVIYGVAVATVVGGLIKPSPSQLLAVSGLIGAALGFGLQDVVRQGVAGLLIVFGRPYSVGDKLAVAEDYGEVTDITLRSTYLRTPDDSQVVVPNDAIFTGSVSNANSGAPEMLVTVDLAVAPEADLEVATDILEEALITSKYVFVDDAHPAVVRVTDDGYYRTLTGKAYVADLRDEYAFTTDVTERAVAAFQREDVPTPTPPAARGNRDS